MNNPKEERPLDSVRELLRGLLDRNLSVCQELYAQTEQLQHQARDLHASFTRAESLLLSHLEAADAENEALRQKVAALEKENLEFAKRYVEMVDHNANLANLYAASSQLHSTLDPAAVIQAIVEIALNLIGAAEFVLYLVDDARREFVVAVREGDAVPASPRLQELLYPIERAAVDEHRTRFAPETQQGPLCCSPFYLGDRLMGALSIYALLSHKKGFSQLDSELFDLLSAQAALAIASSRAYVTVDRKLKTVQQFMDLLKS